MLQSSEMIVFFDLTTGHSLMPLSSGREVRDAVLQIETWYHQYGESVYRRCAWLLADPEAARDITQEVFVRAYRKLSGYKEQASPFTWLVAIADRRCFSLLKKRSYRRRRLQEFSQQEAEQPPNNDCEKHLFQSATIRKLLHCVTRDIQQIVMLRFYDELQQEEIAQELGVSRKTVQRKLNRFYLEAKKILQSSHKKEPGHE